MMLSPQQSRKVFDEMADGSVVHAREPVASAIGGECEAEAGVGSQRQVRAEDVVDQTTCTANEKREESSGHMHAMMMCTGLASRDYDWLDGSARYSSCQNRLGTTASPARQPLSLTVAGYTVMCKSVCLQNPCLHGSELYMRHTHV